MITKLVIALTIICWIIYDVIAGPSGQPTESQQIREWGWQWTVFSFTIGFIVGHWLFPRREVDVSGWMWIIPIWVCLLTFDIVWLKLGLPRIWFRYPGLYVLAGIPAGMYIWGQASIESIIK